MKKYACFLIAALLILSAGSCTKKDTFTCECRVGMSVPQQVEIYKFTTTRQKAQEKCDYLGKDAAVDGPSCMLID